MKIEQLIAFLNAKLAREKATRTVNHFAKKHGLTHVALSKLMRGHYRDVKLSTLNKLAAAFGQTTADFLRDVENFKGEVKI